jgi:glycosyltransferase involved in cell wall biosynthesis
MSKKISINIFFRKPIIGQHYSIENVYNEIITNDHNIFYFKKKICPFESKGFFKRFFLIIWATFNQGDINHVTGDINFINLFFKKRRTILTVPDCYLLSKFNFIYYFLYKLFWLNLPILKSSAVITISKKIKSEILKYTNINKNKIKVINCPLNKIFKLRRKKFNKKPVILIIGTSPNKNMERMISAINGINCKLRIIGQINYKIKDRLNSYCIEYKELFNLTNEQVFQEYKRCDMLLFVSLYEGFGLPIIEAQAVGRPVITSDIEPMKSIGSNGALYVNPYKIDQIQKCILMVINNSSLRTSLINNGLKNASKYKLKKVKKEYLEFYKNFYENIICHNKSI